MGQFLAMGIATQLAVSKEKAEKEKITLEEVLQKMQQTLHFTADIYDFSEEKGYWTWTLKKKIWEGKIVMEEYGGLFNFFRLCFQKAFPEFQMSKALRVYITG